MNATRVSIPAVRRPGILFTIFMLSLLPMHAAEITATITGTLTGGWDRLGIFFQGKEAQSLGGKPFTLVFTFDDAMGKKEFIGNCVSGIAGDGTPSPGRAVLTMGNGSYTFGPADKFSASEITRACDGSSLFMYVSERKGSFFNNSPMVEMRIVPGNGSRTLPASADWKAPMSTDKIDNQSSCVFIGHSGQPGEVKACFDVKTVEISATKPAR